MAELNQITLTRPDDWHLHLRDGAALAAVLPQDDVAVDVAGQRRVRVVAARRTADRGERPQLIRVSFL